jgi:hypothetical protein
MLVLFILGCAGSPATGDAGTEDSGNQQEPMDAGNNTPMDAGPRTDAGRPVDAGAPVDAGMFADAGPCYANCIDQNMAQYIVFQGYELAQCGCQSTSTCASACTSECSTMTVPSETSACGTCIAGQENLGSSSGCISAAGLECELASNCSAFLNCAMACP